MSNTTGNGVVDGLTILFVRKDEYDGVISVQELTVGGWVVNPDNERYFDFPVDLTLDSGNWVDSRSALAVLDYSYTHDGSELPPSAEFVKAVWEDIQSHGIDASDVSEGLIFVVIEATAADDDGNVPDEDDDYDDDEDETDD